MNHQQLAQQLDNKELANHDKQTLLGYPYETTNDELAKHGLVVVVPSGIEYNNRGEILLLGAIRDEYSTAAPDLTTCPYVCRNGIVWVKQEHGQLVEKVEQIELAMEIVDEYRASIQIITDLKFHKDSPAIDLIKSVYFSIRGDVPFSTFRMKENRRNIGDGMVFSINDMPEVGKRQYC
jgi:hypothetical protein